MAGINRGLFFYYSPCSNWMALADLVLEYFAWLFFFDSVSETVGRNFQRGGQSRVLFPGDEFSAWVHRAGADRLQNRFEFGNKSRDVGFGFD